MFELNFIALHPGAAGQVVVMGVRGERSGDHYSHWLHCLSPPGGCAPNAMAIHLKVLKTSQQKQKCQPVGSVRGSDDQSCLDPLRSAGVKVYTNISHPNLCNSCLDVSVT